MSPEQARHAQKKSFPKTQLGIMHTAGCKVLPDRQQLLRTISPGGTGAELGVAFGDFSLEILELNRPRKLFLVDTWGGERYGKGLEVVKKVLAAPLAAGQVEILQGRSVEILEAMPDGSLDWVYIDTDHSYRGTFDELVVASRKVKATGIIAGHDFCTGNVVAPVPYGVVEACSKFVVDYKWSYRFITLESDGHFSFGLTKLP